MKRIVWTEKRIIEEGRKYNTSRTYWAAYYQNILDEVLPEKKRRKPKVKL